MAKEMQNSSMYIEHDQEGYESAGIHKNLDDDGRPKRSGTWITASAHIITAVIGSGVLSLAWAIAQLGWVVGPLVLIAFSFITFFTSTLLADSYRSPDPITGKRNYTYMDAVKANLGGRKVQLCGLAQYANLIGVTIGYTITASISMVWDTCKDNLNRLNSWGGRDSSTESMEDIPGSRGHCLCVCLLYCAHRDTGKPTLALSGRRCYDLQEFPLGYRDDTLKSSPPENKAMKRASLAGVLTTTMFYVLCGCLGYAAFGNDAPGNFLTGFGFYEPFWLIDIANICITAHLIGAYQMLSWACLAVSLVSAAGSVEGLIKALKTYKPFKVQQ
ncbi:unnamed protein product [Dovyalis caffra]|uniref:Amino acid transporter transmembrane domain-containing protein n=1 Tax=Dovyalis caffra TaxID=77055 RepID=A0AAV1SBX5_9ROSI|nr:unnamed protein product [Dovyalis caffra]